jgi:hypothetical protein
VAVCPGATVADDEEDTAKEKSCPTPVSEAFCGLPLALSVTVRVPFRVPLVVGSKKTPMEQLESVPSATGIADFRMRPRNRPLFSQTGVDYSSATLSQELSCDAGDCPRVRSFLSLSILGRASPSP